MKTWHDETLERIEEHDSVEKARIVGGERDFVAGQRDMEYVDVDVTLTYEAADRISLQRARVEPDGTPIPSALLDGILNWFELELGLAPGDNWTTKDSIDYRVIQVTMQKDHRR